MSGKVAAAEACSQINSCAGHLGRRAKALGYKSRDTNLAPSPRPPDAKLTSKLASLSCPRRLSGWYTSALRSRAVRMNTTSRSSGTRPCNGWRR